MQNFLEGKVLRRYLYRLIDLHVRVHTDHEAIEFGLNETLPRIFDRADNRFPIVK